MPNNKEGIKTGVKNFTDEEKAAIVARAKRIEYSRVAKEFNTTWQTVSAIVKIFDAEQQTTTEEIKEKKSAPVSEVKTQTATSSKNSSNPTAKPVLKRNSDFTPEERAAILQRVKEIGPAKAAREAGTSRWIVNEWRKKAKLISHNTESAAKVSDGNVKTEKINNSHSKVSLTLVEELQIENAVLKEKIAALSEQMDKLKIAVGNLV